MSESNQVRYTSHGISALGLLAVGLGILFIAFKLTGVITWSWWLVLLPLILYFGLFVLLFFVVLLVIFVVLILGLIVGLLEKK